jgi:hypothetical protein
MTAAIKFVLFTPVVILFLAGAFTLYLILILLPDLFSTYHGEVPFYY